MVFRPLSAALVTTALLAGSPLAALTGDCTFRNPAGVEVSGPCALEGGYAPGETGTLAIAGTPVAQVTFLDGSGFMWANTLRVDGQVLSFDPEAGRTNCWVAAVGPAMLCVSGMGIH